MLNAQFLGIVQIIVYAGAIMVLFLYILMMLNLNAKRRVQQEKLYEIHWDYFRRNFINRTIRSLQRYPGTAKVAVSDNGVGLTKT